MCMYVHAHMYDICTYIFHDEEQNAFFTIYFIHLMSKVIMSQRYR